MSLKTSGGSRSSFGAEGTDHIYSVSAIPNRSFFFVLNIS